MGIVKVMIVIALLYAVAILREKTATKWKNHFRIIEEMEETELWYRELRAGLHEPEDESDKVINQMNEYDFERFIFEYWNDYEYGYLIAETKWHKYLEEAQHVRMEIANSPYPSEESVIYITDNQ